MSNTCSVSPGHVRTERVVIFGDLSSNQLSGSIPASVSALSQLTTLYLYKNQLTGSIPAEIGSMTKLEYVSLANNQLNGAVPAAIASLTKLAFL
ncbi:unnamed protein product [Closterium sp. Yama58-4]|nr:unnamed protein product [Closterium sp. Yama58-4]